LKYMPAFNVNYVKLPLTWKLTSFVRELCTNYSHWSKTYRVTWHQFVKG
jgi:hypothetical protein